MDFFAAAREAEALKEAILARVEQVLLSGKVLQGPAVSRLESRIARHCGRRHAVAVGSGSDALLFALQALGIGPGDDVLCPAVSFVATALAISRAGARPVFVDVVPGDCMMDLGKAADALSPRCRAMVFVQLFGAMRPPAEIEAFAERHGLLLVEDGAQGFGASHNGRACGGTGAASAISFDPTKVLGAPGSGGAVLTDDPMLAEAVRRLRYHGRANGISLSAGGNSQMSSIVAEVLDLKLDHHEAWTHRRDRIAGRYRDGLRDTGLALPAPAPSGGVHAWHKFVVHSPARDALAEALAARGVPTAIHYPRPLPREPVFAEEWQAAAFPVADAHAGTALSLPIHAMLRDAEVAHVIDAVRDAARPLPPYCGAPLAGTIAS